MRFTLESHRTLFGAVERLIDRFGWILMANTLLLLASSIVCITQLSLCMIIIGWLLSLQALIAVALHPVCGSVAIQRTGS